MKQNQFTSQTMDFTLPEELEVGSGRFASHIVSNECDARFATVHATNKRVCIAIARKFVRSWNYIEGLQDIVRAAVKDAENNDSRNLSKSGVITVEARALLAKINRS